MTPYQQCFQVKRPSLFFAILDFVIFFIILIGLLQLDYSPMQKIAKKEKIGRILVSLMMLMRCLFSVLSEYVRKAYLVRIYLDKAQAFKIFAIVRYIVTVSMVIPIIVASRLALHFEGVMLVILVGILTFEELVILGMVIYKLRNAPKTAI